MAVINEAAARTLWNGEDPIGKRFSFPNAPALWIEIVGIVGDVRHQGLDAALEPEGYLAFHQFQVFSPIGQAMTFVVRTERDLDAMAPLLKTSVHEVDANQPVERIRTVETAIDESIAPRRLNLWLLATFSFVAVMVTASGLYGVMLYLVAERWREIGVRRALGASGQGILVLMIRQAVVMTAGGVAAGIVLSLGLSRYIGALLYGVDPTDATIYVAVTALLILVTMVATLVPSIRAVRIDPLTACFATADAARILLPQTEQSGR